MAIDGKLEAKSTIKRSRKGCHNCKRLKIKCDEEKPKCSYCVKTNNDCDYSIKLTWGGRPYKDASKRKNPFQTVLTTDNPTPPPKKKKPKPPSTPSNNVKFIMDQTLDTKASASKSDNMGLSSSMTTVELSGSNSMGSSNNLSEPLQSTTSLSSSQPPYVEPREATKISDIDGPGLKFKQLSSVGSIMLHELQNTNHENSASSPQDDDKIKIEDKNASLFIDSPKLSDFIQKSNDLANLPSIEDFNTVKLPSGLGSDYNYSPHTMMPDDFAKPKFTASPSQPTNHDQINYKLNDSRTNSFSSLINTFPSLSNGIENLTNALEKVADGGNQFSLQNSEIFNRFLNSNIDDKKSPTYMFNSPNFSIGLSPEITKTQPSSKLDDDFINNYSVDLAKSEAYMASNIRGQFKSDSPMSVVGFTSFLKNPHKIKEIFDNYKNIDDQLDDDEDSFPLDDDNSPASSISFINNIESIPPSLIPLPELLNQVPYYRQLMHFWITTAADNLVPAPKHIYHENPFKIILPQMAMEYPAILTTILAFAAKSMASITRNEPPVEIIDQLISRSCNMLLKMLKDKDEATSDGTLATVLLLSCYEVLSTNNFERHRAHTLGARQIIKARRLKNPSHKYNNKDKDDSQFDSPDSGSSSKGSIVGTEGDIAFFLMRWFVYVDVIGALSATHQSEFYLAQQDGNETDYATAESVNNLNSLDSALHNIDPKRDIDYILGFDVKFLPYLTEIVMLIRKVNHYFQDELCNRNLLPIDIIVKGMEVKEKLFKAYEEGEARRQERLDKMSNFTTNLNTSPKEMSKKHKRFNHLIKQDFVLRCTNKFFYNMGLLNLLRRVLQIPRSAAIIQELATEIGSILQANIASGSSAEICSIFCLFCAGCETLDEDMQLLFRDRFTKLSEMGNILASKSFTIMTRCWQTGEDWIEASKQLDIDITLL